MMLSDIHIDNLNQKLSISRRVTLVSYAGLLALYTLLNLAQPNGTLGWWLIQCVPLLIFIPGLIGNHYKTYSWLCFVVLLYFTGVVPPLMSDGRNWSHWVQLILIVILFNGAMFSSRWRQRQMVLEQQAPVTDQDNP